MRKNRVKELWREGKPVAAGWISSGNRYITENMAHAGFDALIVDMQHGMAVTPDMAAACLQVISTTDTVPIVRVPWNRPEWIQYVLDAGAMGIIVPMVNTYEEAASAGGACRYPPLGYRSAGPNRAVLYGGADYLASANDEIICLVMTETKEAIENLEELAKAPGIDGFYIGPGDLAQSLGVPAAEARTNERHLQACQRVLDVANATGLVACHHSSGAEHAAHLFKQGFKMSQIGSDTRLLLAACADAHKTLAETSKKLA